MTDHVDAGAYVLGLLEPAERAAFEHHLATCPHCARQVRELSPVEPLLAEYAASARASGLDPADPAPLPGGHLLDRLVAETTAVRRRGRVRRLALALAATAMLVAGPAVTAAVITADSGPAAVALADSFTATDPTTGAHATVGLGPTTWGSRVTLQLAGVQGPLTCTLVAVPTTGQPQPVTTWTVPPGGYPTLRTDGGTGLQPAQIDHFEVRVQPTGTVLVTIPTHHS
ncbi:zf-HC2 domain-containing protein [Streptomyces sp. NRRL WC-3742]|uniref:zf-HC2 domain-containing protein n=1 Tax=Streptomyces sp. NRRL WC-3742 TaxID=1463934 RepID=UPI0004C9B81D|nr:zf-HC2 domain-containing protein [Streptomyces sp. NRRL WC-3742]